MDRDCMVLSGSSDQMEKLLLRLKCYAGLIGKKLLDNLVGKIIVGQRGK